MEDLDRLETWAAPLLARLSTGERQRLARMVARDLRQANAATMRAQRAPDGKAWQPRKAKVRDAAGRIKKQAKAQAMFVKLRAAKHLKATASAFEATVGFSGRTERIAWVHHKGLRDQVSPDGPAYVYPARPLLGITDRDLDRVRGAILDWMVI